MTNEEFQKLVLEKLQSLELGQEEIKEKLKFAGEQTAELTEFRQEVKEELTSIKSTISRIEIATADNWSDIAKLKSVR
ncbi:MAG: plasmid stabilization protein [Clostridiaceae bacterium]|nr:plasmid stabilization protein [Clostridiaceae bacterium]